MIFVSKTNMLKTFKNTIILAWTVIFLISVLGVNWVEHTCLSCEVTDIHFFELQKDCHQTDLAEEHQDCHHHEKENSKKTHFEDICCSNDFNYLKIEENFLSSNFKIKLEKKDFFLVFLHFFKENIQILDNIESIFKFTFPPPNKLVGKSFTFFSGQFIL